MNQRHIFRDAIAMEALLLDLVSPLASLKTQHRSEVAGCLATAMALETGDRTKLEKLLSAVSELCNKLPNPTMIRKCKEKLISLSSTRIVARGLMVWIKEALSSPKLYSGQDYQR